MSCNHLREFLTMQIDLIEQHIDNHKWYNHIEDKNEAAADFINKFGWIMRACYCTYVCPDASGCQIRKD